MQEFCLERFWFFFFPSVSFLLFLKIKTITVVPVNQQRYDATPGQKQDRSPSPDHRRDAAPLEGSLQLALNI